jgi:chemotaxis regulatin CheY-phosphate phosphatase CheZ
MEQPNVTSPEPRTENDSPEILLQEFRARNVALDLRLDKLLESIQQIRDDIRYEAELDLSRLSKAAVDMMNGRVYQQVDIQAKGELGILVKTINQTMTNLQQLDASVKDQSTRVPELAAQLDAITADTELATQDVMNRLDSLMARAEEAGRFFAEIQKNAEEYRAGQEHLLDGISKFLDRAKKGENSAKIAQEILDYVFAFQISPKPEPVDFAGGQELLRTVSDEAFEILNVLQFQDITRQKTEKVIQLLKQFRQSLDRLLAIFKMADQTIGEDESVFENRNVATQDNIFKTGVTAGDSTNSVDDIIAQFKAAL